MNIEYNSEIERVRDFITDAQVELNKDYANWKELVMAYEKGSNMDLDDAIVSNSGILSIGVDNAFPQLTFPSFDIRFVTRPEDSKIMNVLSKNGLENILRESEIYNAFHGYNGIFFNTVLKGNGIGFVSYDKGIKIQSLPLSNVYFEKSTTSLEDDSTGSKTGIIGYVERFPNKKAFEVDYPEKEGGQFNMVPTVNGLDEIQVFKYFNFREKIYLEISGTEVLVNLSGEDFPYTHKTSNYFNANPENRGKINKNLKTRNPFFLFRKNYKSDNIYATGLGQRLYEINRNKTKMDSMTVLNALNNAIGFKNMNVERGGIDEAENRLSESLENIKAGKPALSFTEVDATSNPNLGKIENIQSPISTDELLIVNSIASEIAGANGVNVTGSANTKYKNEQAIMADNQASNDKIQSYISINLQVFKRMFETVINMIAEHYENSYEKFSIEGVFDKNVENKGFFSYSELALLIQGYDLKVIMDGNSGVIPSSTTRFQKAQTLLSMAAQANVDPNLTNEIFKSNMNLAGIAYNFNQNEQPIQPNQTNVAPQGGVRSQ